MNKPEDLARQKAEHKKQKRLRAEYEGTLTKRNKNNSPGYKYEPSQEEFNQWASYINSRSSR